MNVFSEMHEWSKKPFDNSMDVKHWVAFIGLIIIAIVFWSQIINFIVS